MSPPMVLYELNTEPHDRRRPRCSHASINRFENGYQNTRFAIQKTSYLTSPALSAYIFRVRIPSVLYSKNSVIIKAYFNHFITIQKISILYK